MLRHILVAEDESFRITRVVVGEADEREDRARPVAALLLDGGVIGIAKKCGALNSRSAFRILEGELRVEIIARS